MRFGGGKARFNTEFTELEAPFAKGAQGKQRAQRRAGPSQIKVNRMPALPGLVVAAEGAAELDGGETEFVAEVIGGFG